MSPEELDATREGVNVDYAPEISYDDWQAMEKALLAHIDQLAATIENLKAALDEAKVDRVNFSSACQEEHDSQAAQIEALKKEADCSDIVQALEDAGIPMGDGEQDIITAIEILGSRIESLKEKLVEE